MVDADAVVGQLRVPISLCFGLGAEDSVHAARFLQLFLECGKRNVGIQRHALIGPQTEASQSLGRDDLGDAEPHGIHGRPFAAHRAFRRYCAGLGDSNENGVTLLHGKQPGQRLIEHNLVVPWLMERAAAAELPEAFVAADEIHLIDAAWRLAIGGFHAGDFENDGRSILLRSIAGQLLAEEVIGDEHFVDIPQPGEDEIAEAALHGVAYEQGPGEHGGAHRHAAGDRHVHFPEVAKGEQDEAKW